MLGQRIVFARIYPYRSQDLVSGDEIVARSLVGESRSSACHVAHRGIHRLREDIKVTAISCLLSVNFLYNKHNMDNDKH